MACNIITNEWLIRLDLIGKSGQACLQDVILNVLIISYLSGNPLQKDYMKNAKSGQRHGKLPMPMVFVVHY